MVANSDDLGSKIDSGLVCLINIAGFHRIAADYGQLKRELGLQSTPADNAGLIRGARMLGLKAGLATPLDASRLETIPLPAILRIATGRYLLFTTRVVPAAPDGAEKLFRVVDPISRTSRDFRSIELLDGHVDAILFGRSRTSADAQEKAFGINWFLPAIFRYRQSIFQVIMASLFVQLFGLVTPLFFQVVIDKVLAHKSYGTLYVIAAGLFIITVFDVVLQQARTYILSHTTSRIDVELGQRLFSHLLKLPIYYFDRRGSGLTVARMRELETVRTFLTGQALFSVLDLVFGIVFVGIMLAYSVTLTFWVLLTIPIYIAIGAIIRPIFRDRLNERFNRSSANNQFLVETVLGIQTIKASAVEPSIRAQWEESLAGYVRAGFETTNLGALGQNAVQFVSKITTLVIMLFGAYGVINGDLSVGALIAFNMIAAQAVQPILRLSQFWQDFQQVQISIDRLGDVLNAPIEYAPRSSISLERPRGQIIFENVAFRYNQEDPDTLQAISLQLNAGEVVGVVGPSGSGKSTLTKLIQRLYSPTSGRILLDGLDIAELDPSWLRSQIGVVLQDNMLFHRSIHDNIAFSNPAMPRSEVVAASRLAAADEFISRLPRGYDSIVEERGANLSGGQRQRIAIARALITNPPILIFDEATSALDYESERLIRQNMIEIAKGRTVIIVAHRLSAVRFCDRIIGLQDGRIVEQGPHTRLLDAKGLYARLWAMQNEL